MTSKAPAKRSSTKARKPTKSTKAKPRKTPTKSTKAKPRRKTPTKLSEANTIARFVPTVYVPPLPKCVRCDAPHHGQARTNFYCAVCGLNNPPAHEYAGRSAMRALFESRAAVPCTVCGRSGPIRC